ncbi:MAG TPA: NADH:flavin oxidoreductase [Ramlibacter sp.]|nr:NADH:flavin oxidoreductase [Ramlibacter sp.]
MNEGPVNTPSLFSPVSLGSLKLRNRVVMAPMTRERAEDGIVTPAIREYYRRRAHGGVGLILTEGTPVDDVGAFGTTVPRFYGPARESWRQVVEAVHAEGACIVPQLWHVGAFDPSLIGMEDSAAITRISPSGLAAQGKPMGRAMTAADIESAIEAYADAASGAQELGFDGVEIHGAHGYLPDQFLWAATNLRSDDYGGDRQARTRFAVKLVHECRRRVGNDFPILFRYSQWKQLDYDARLAESPQELEEVLTPLAEAGVDVFHCSTRRYWEPAFAGSDLSLAAWTRRLTGKPVIAVGSVSLSNEFKSALGKVRADVVPDEMERLQACLARGDFDLIAVGRAMIANPDWVRKMESGSAADLKSFAKEMLEGLE